MSSFSVIYCQGGLDDGRGRARVGLFRHKHEIDSGRTSSVGMEVSIAIIVAYSGMSPYLFLQILGFSTSGAPILPATAASSDPDVIRREKLGWEQISSQAAKIVSFIGLYALILPAFSDIKARLGRSRALFEDNALWAYLRVTFMYCTNGRCKCRTDRDVEGTLGHISGFKCPRSGLYH